MYSYWVLELNSIKNVSTNEDVKNGNWLMGWICLWSIVPDINTPPKLICDSLSFSIVTSIADTYWADIWASSSKNNTSNVRRACCSLVFLLVFWRAYSAQQNGDAHELLSIGNGSSLCLCIPINSICMKIH